MIECAVCDSPQFLQITQSRIKYDESEVSEVDEQYECVACGATGRHVTRSYGKSKTLGDVRDTDEQPTNRI